MSPNTFFKIYFINTQCMECFVVQNVSFRPKGFAKVSKTLPCLLKEHAECTFSFFCLFFLHLLFGCIVFAWLCKWKTLLPAFRWLKIILLQARPHNLKNPGTCSRPLKTKPILRQNTVKSSSTKNLLTLS